MELFHNENHRLIWFLEGSVTKDALDIYIMSLISNNTVFGIWVTRHFRAPSLLSDTLRGNIMSRQCFHFKMGQTFRKERTTLHEILFSFCTSQFNILLLILLSLIIINLSLIITFILSLHV